MRRSLGGRRPHGAAAPLDLRPVDPRSGDPQVPSSSDVSRPARLPSRWYVVPLLVVAAAAMAHAVTGGGGGDAGPRGFGGDERAPPGWQRGAVGPLRSRVGHVSVWTGSELVVWGGEPAADGAAYNPSTASWRRIRPAPFPASTGAASAWTGFELLVWGGDTGGPRAVVTANGGAYDIGADVWRRLSPAPLTARRPLAAAWTGERFVVVGGTTGDGEWLADGAAYDPQSNRWTAVAPLPIAFRQAVAMWTGQELVVFGTTSDDPAKSTAVAWHPASDRWRVLPDSPLTGSRVTAVWTGHELVAWDDGLRSAALEVVSGKWRGLPDIPSIPGFCDPTGVLAGDVVFAELCGRGAVLDPVAGHWSTIPHPYFLSGQPVWTGQRLMWWTGAFRGSRDSIWMFTPGAAGRPEGAAAPPRAPPVGGQPCRVDVSGEAQPPAVRRGGDFVWSLTVANRSPCRFARVAVNALVSPTSRVRYWLVAEQPGAIETMLHSFSAEAADVGVMWMGDEPLEPGAVRRFSVRGRLAATSASGRIVDDVDVVATADGPGRSDAVGRLRLDEIVISDGVPPTPRLGSRRTSWGRLSAGPRPAPWPASWLGAGVRADRSCTFSTLLSLNVRQDTPAAQDRAVGAGRRQAVAEDGRPRPLPRRARRADTSDDATASASARSASVALRIRPNSRTRYHSSKASFTDRPTDAAKSGSRARFTVVRIRSAASRAWTGWKAPSRVP